MLRSGITLTLLRLFEDVKQSLLVKFQGVRSQMREKDIVGSWIPGILTILLVCASFQPCFGAGTQVQQVQNQVVIFSGQIPYGDGNVSIRSESGILYQIPAMTPVGIIQALAGTGMIDSYCIGDELVEKRGIFTLDGINSYQVSGQEAWFVLVNGVQLREYLLPSVEGLNTRLLKDGDDVLFAYGDPTKPASAAKALVWVQVGNKNDVMQLFSPSIIMGRYVVSQVPVSSEPTVVPTPVPVTTTVEPTIEPTVESTPVPVTTTVEPTIEPTVESTPVPVTTTVEPVIEPTVVSTPVPVTTTVEPTIEPTVVSTPVPVTTTVEPTIEPTVEPAPVLTPSEEPVNETGELTNTTELIEIEPLPEPAIQKSTDDRMLYSGVYALPNGTVNITDSSGIEYEIPVNTPLGLLHMLHADKKVNNLCIDDRGMHKGGILILEGINEFFNTATKVWFVRVNGRLLEDYVNPRTDGLNIYLLMAGDTISYYYGDPVGSLQDAEATIVVTLG